jgi:signal transduction histidine kinase
VEGVGQANGGARRTPVEGILGVQRLLDPTGDDRVLATRAAGAMMVVGAALIAITVAMPPAARGSDAAILGIGVLAGIVGAALFIRQRVGELVLDAAIVFGTALITVATVVAGPGRGTEDNEVLFLWVIAYSFWFLRLPHALFQLALVGVADVFLLADQGHLNADAITRWVVTMATYLVVGLLLNGLRARIEHQREERTQLAVLDERMRIARELYDATGHGVNVMSIQAAAALNTLDRDPEKARDALEAIKRTSRDTAQDMRRMLSVLRERELTADELNRSSLALLDPLIDQSRDAGVEVQLSVIGEPREIPSGLDQAAYRVIEEALTTISKHAASGERATVTVTYGANRLDLEILDEALTDGASLGHADGLIGMRERVAAFDGELETGPLALGGGFRLVARFPLRRRGDQP